jgi:Dolichyl-phosphate-mannose-protein mannosyltransferase
VFWPSSTNFFPFYPLLLRIGMFLGGGPAITGVVISLAASLAALYFVHELARDLFDRDVARAATLATAFFPTAFFLNAVYTEAVFLAAAAGSVWAARTQGNFVLAGVLGCIAAMTRNVGVFLLLPLAQEWWRKRQEVGVWGAAPLALVPAGLAAYMFWLWRWSSHPLLFSTVVHKTWGRTLTSPFTVFHRAWDRAGFGAPVAAHPWRIFQTLNPNNSYDAMGTVDFVVLLILVVLLAVAVVRVPRGLAAYAVLGAALPVLTPPQVLPLASLSRYVLALFPVFFALGLLLARRRYLLYGWLAASASVGVILTLSFTTWKWVG